jgi:hypothetical protein
VPSAQSRAACADHCVSSVRRLVRHLRLTRPISTQLQKRLRNGHFLHARKELCGRFTRPLTALRAPLRRRGIALPDADSHHEKKLRKSRSDACFRCRRACESRESAQTDSQIHLASSPAQRPTAARAAIRARPFRALHRRALANFRLINRARRGIATPQRSSGGVVRGSDAQLRLEEIVDHLGVRFAF